MSKTYKDRPEKYSNTGNFKKKEGRRFESSKGRSKQNLKNQFKDLMNNNAVLENE